MASNISEEELLLRKRARRRLVGAIALVIAAIIILPLIFDEEPEMSQHEIAIRIPSETPVSEPSPPLQTYDELPVNDATEEIIDELNVYERAEPLPFESAAPTQIEPHPVENLEKQNAVPVPAVKPQENSASVDADLTLAERAQVPNEKTFVVQLGAFSDHSKAMHQQQNLVSQGINAYTETLMANNKEMMRVRVGPFSTRNAAEQELVKLRKLGLDGVVTVK